jgi:hypothetical protein
MIIIIIFKLLMMINVCPKCEQSTLQHQFYNFTSVFGHLVHGGFNFVNVI